VQLILIDEKTYFLIDGKTYFLIDGKTYFLIVLDLGIRHKSIEWFLPALVRTVICATESLPFLTGYDSFHLISFGPDH
jgi:hypothetical protein